MVFLKRVSAVPGKVILESLNSAYPQFEIDTHGDMADAVRILGRAVWWCREG
jgi:phage repressor protein C with HTH and peptisase S24 domain